VTSAPERPKRRAGRRPNDPGPETFEEWFRSIADVCATCFGHRAVWCPSCAGFGGCSICRHTEKVRCPQCAGGKLDGWRW
jgi:hypothetical protein